MILSVQIHKNTRARPYALAMLAAAVLFIAPAAAKQATYTSPEDAVAALVAAARDGKTDAIVGVLGDEGRALVNSGDPVADEALRARFVNSYDEKHSIEEGKGEATLVIGNDEFPFPIPIVQEGGKWQFNAAAGKEEILARRIGENELSAIATARAYVDAQREYAETDHDGNGAQYARRFLSSEGKTDGLYWPAVEGEAQSPLGPLIAEAHAEGYKKQAGQPTPYHGYLYRIITMQGKNAAGGARDYIVGGRMIGGFGLVAVPAEYGNSGVMTLIVNQDGKVFQKDLGPDTARLAAGIKSFDPDESWKGAAGE